MKLFCYYSEINSLMMANVKWFFIITLVNFSVCNGYKFLLVFPLPSKSHGILGDNMVKHLLDAGHDVTYVTPYHYNRQVHHRLNIVDVSATTKIFNPQETLNVKHIMDKEVNFRSADVMTNLLIDLATITLENENLQKYIRESDEKFDAVISEWMFSDLYSTFAAVFNCPLIWFSTVDPHWIILNLSDGPTNPAYTSDYLHDNVPPFSFTQRVSELWTQVDGLIKKNFIYYYKEEAVYKRLIVPVLKEKGRPIPSYETLRYNASLTLGNSQVVIGDAFSLPQSYKHIGGYHINEEVAALPENLKNVMDNSKQGVIYFSMGSNLNSKHLPMEVKRGILKVFESLKQTVIWKFEEVFPDTPKNVHMVQWAPQQSILAHPNTVLFITHGGLLSMTETIHFGVPIITIPVFADQFLNSVRAEKKGFGKKVDLSYLMANDLKVAIDEVLNNTKYFTKAKELSLAYHDMPMKAKEELVYWTSHVARTRGAPHLRSPAQELYLYQRVYIDLMVVVLLIILILRAVIKYILSIVAKNNTKAKQL